MESLRAHHANMIGIVSLGVQVTSDRYALTKWDKNEFMVTALQSKRFNMAGLAHHMDILALAEIPPDKNTSDEDTTCNDAYTTCSACSASKQSAGLCEKCHKETIDYYKQGCGEQDEEREAEEETEDEEEMEDEEDEDREEDEGTEKETKENSTVSSAGGANAPNAAVYSGANALTAFVELLCQQVHTPGCMGSGEEVQQANRDRKRGGRNGSWYYCFYRRRSTTRRPRQHRPPAAAVRFARERLPPRGLRRQIAFQNISSSPFELKPVQPMSWVYRTPCHPCTKGKAMATKTPPANATATATAKGQARANAMITVDVVVPHLTVDVRDTLSIIC